MLGYKRKRGSAANKMPLVLSSAGRRKYYKARITRARRTAQNIRTAGYLGIERKFYDTAKVASNITAPSDASGGEQDPATVLCVSAPSQGTGESQRDGRNIQAKSINVKGIIKVNKQGAQTSTDDWPIAYVALVLDKQSNAAQLNSEDVFINPGGQAILATSPFLNLENQQRFQVCATKTIVLRPSSVAGVSASLEQSGYSVPFSLFKKVNTKINFNGTDAGIASVTDNSYHIIAYCSDTSVGPQLSYNCRMRFYG
jgi:hypothetical protein